MSKHLGYIHCCRLHALPLGWAEAEVEAAAEAGGVKMANAEAGAGAEAGSMLLGLKLVMGMMLAFLPKMSPILTHLWAFLRLLYLPSRHSALRKMDLLRLQLETMAITPLLRPYFLDL